MDRSDERDRDSPREDEPEDREPGAEDGDAHAESGEDESGAPSASDPDPSPRADGRVLDVALEPVTEVLGELVDVDTTPPPDAGRTGTGRSSRSGGSTGSRPSRGDADVRSPDEEEIDEYRVETRRSDDELVVTADLPDVAADELFVGLDEEEGSLVVAVNDDVIAREFYPWEAVEVASTRFDAPDLAVRLEPTHDSASG